ncbi:hypothetical protein PWT90_03701 [Aphanocladium album]|nr:hypothetical protein PWT90_03701 [Aphanocladium album]
MSADTPSITTPLTFREFIDYQRSLPAQKLSESRNPGCNGDEQAEASITEEEQIQDTALVSDVTIFGDERSQRHDSTTSTLVVEDPNDRPYSTFTGFQKKNIVIMASIAAFLSPLSSQIYLPATQKIGSEYGVSSTQVNLTMTVFIIMQGIVPSFVATFADNFGRRPVYLVCFPIYIAANIGLALQRQYGALIALRCLQGIGSSAMATLSSAIVADMITSAERGTYMGFTQIGSILGPAIGPVLGGVISQYTDWHYIFWLLTGLSVAIFVPLLILLPETCRRLVGDGSIPAPVSNQSVLRFLRGRKERRQAAENTQTSDEESQKEALPPTHLEIVQAQKRSLNLLGSLTIMLDIETALLIFCNSFAYACFIAVTTGIPSQFHRLYQVNEMQTSLIYIPLSLGTLISAVSTGQLVNWNFKRYALKHGYPLTRNRQHDLDGFPVEKARLEIAWPLMLVAAGSLILYGWIMHLNTNIAAPVIVLFIFGYTNVAAYKMTGILLVDIHPGEAATVNAASNLIKSAFGAASSAAVVALIQTMGIGWTFTLLSLMWVALSPCFLILMYCGPRWRKERAEREARRMERKNSQELDKEFKRNNSTL